MQHQRRPVATYRHFFFTAYTLRNKVEIKVQYRWFDLEYLTKVIDLFMRGGVTYLIFIQQKMWRRESKVQELQKVKGDQDKLENCADK